MPDQTSTDVYASAADVASMQLADMLKQGGFVIEEVGSSDQGVIMNVSSPAGTYLYTVTVSRTPGY